MNRQNLTVVTSALASPLLFEGRSCVGLEYRQGGKLERVEAEREVILCGGAIASPQLLMLSGIGEAEALRRLGIPVVAELPGVGRNLHDHVLSFIIDEAAKPIPPQRNNGLEAHLFAKSDTGLLGPDQQPLFMANAPPLPQLEIPPNSYALAAGIIRPVSRGRLALTANDVAAPLDIDPQCLAEPSDLACLIDVMEAGLELMHAAPLAAWRKRHLYPAKTDRASLGAYVRETLETYHHQVGTCKMGIDRDSVVDPELRVYGIEGLRVADASIMPAVPSGNTNAPAIMVGEKAADLIRGMPPLRQ
jgi:choline dehydrogenase